MINSKNRFTRNLVVFSCVVLSMLGHETIAQEDVLDQEFNSDEFTGIRNAGMNSREDVKTLEQVRSMGGLETGLRPMISGTGKYAGAAAPGNYDGAGPSISPRALAMARIRSLQQSLSLPNADRSELVPKLRIALSEYFIADMRHRVHELDEIKAKVTETEANLQKRLDSQEDAVDLQLKIMLHEADGLGFFHKDDARTQSGFGSNSELSGPALPGVGNPSWFGFNGPPHIPSGAPAGLTKPSTPNTQP